jgi:hypothetical protein
MSIATPPAPYGTILGPDGQTIACPRWAPSPEIVDARIAAMKRSYFLVRIAGNDGIGELARCASRKGGCGGRHPYLTRNCVERPFHGLDQVLYVMWQQAGDLAAVKSLSPADAARHNAGQIVDDVPDLATMHPEWARQMGKQAALERFDVAVGGVTLGTAEQIPRTLAQRLLDRINQNRPIDGRLQIEGLVS